ncbi:MAG TPA: hypothetical protein VD994_16365, partial [Prosthecobacter sp.]|nr:hypothetical protein [Prosthecobacter sp.]
VALAGSEVAGFTLTFMRHELPPEVKDGPRIESVIGDAPYFLIKQVGVALAHQRRKVGRALYEHLLSGLTIPAFAPIVISPDHVNICSTAFHEKLGFTQVESLNDAHGQPISGLWCRPAPQA